MSEVMKKVTDLVEGEFVNLTPVAKWINDAYYEGNPLVEEPVDNETLMILDSELALVEDVVVETNSDDLHRVCAIIYTNLANLSVPVDMLIPSHGTAD